MKKHAVMVNSVLWGMLTLMSLPGFSSLLKELEEQLQPRPVEKCQRHLPPKVLRLPPQLLRQIRHLVSTGTRRVTCTIWPTVQSMQKSVRKTDDLCD